MINYFGRSSNTVVIPEYHRDLVLKAIAQNEAYMEDKAVAERNTSLDFYYNRNIDTHLEQWFPGDALNQVPAYGQRLVPRFARARMMLYKDAPIRLIGGEESEDYKAFAYHLNSKAREFAEICWLLGEGWLKTKWNEKRQRLEYDIIPSVKKYFIEGESEPYGISYEVSKDMAGNRIFIFWSEARDGEQGYHFKYTQGGKRLPVAGNPEMLNPYGILPFSKVCNSTDASDVVRSAIQIGIAMTEIALGVRYSLGQPVLTGVDEETQIKSGIERVLILPEGATFNYVSPTGSLSEMIEAVKSMANQTAENNHLRIRWGESGGNVPSGESLRILEIENIESRESDIPIWREWEQMRYEVDRTVIETHTGKSLPEDLSIDFGEVSFPLSPQEERNWLDWKLDKGIMTKRELLLYFNPDMSDDEIDLKLGAVQEEKIAETPTAASPLLEALRTPVA